MADTHRMLDAKPPSNIREVYKKYQKLGSKALASDKEIVDASKASNSNTLTTVKPTNLLFLPPDLRTVYYDFTEIVVPGDEDPIPAVAHGLGSLPGLFVYPSLLSHHVQLRLLENLLHRDLMNAEHKTNVHMHYNIRYPPSSGTDDQLPSFFDPAEAEMDFQPRDCLIHKPITTNQFLSRKLRWMTLGGQYDWTAKSYPSGPPPPFPADIKKLVESLFPMKAEAAIVNLYSSSDTLSLHRDVSEECDQPLVSISLGCDGIFVAGLDARSGDKEPRVAVLRLRSGDAILMSGESRYAWHGVPKVLPGTCPGWMENWPCMGGEDSSRYEGWRGWIKGKRINLNVRQMFA